MLSYQLLSRTKYSSLKADCAQAFKEGTTLKTAATCAVCARRTFSHDLLFTKKHTKCNRFDVTEVSLEALRIIDPFVLSRPGNHFDFQNPFLDGLALDCAGLHLTVSPSQIDICSECKTQLDKVPSRIPPLSLANGNIRGFLPEDLQDCTWLEERLCAKFLASAYVIRLYDFTGVDSPEERPRVMKGHSCAFPLNTMATATKLPWSFSDAGPLVSCLVIGPRKPRPADLRNVFKVRKQKVRALLDYLKANFKDYPQFEVDKAALDSLPEDDVPELFMRHVVYQNEGLVPSLFDQETSGIEPHPGLSEADDIAAENGRTFIEHHGLLDVHGVSVPQHKRAAAALKNATGLERPDLIIKHETVKRVADHVALGGSLRSLTGEEQTIFTLLKKCELISVKVPGSKAIMNRARADIRSYVGEHGIFQLFLTLNPRPEHAPSFQIFFGDTTVELNLRAPQMPPHSTRAIRVADDPVAAAGYFHFQVAAIFQYLFGWDIRSKASTPEGGILGRLSAFFLVKEHTMRGQLHGHALLWLEGGLNPGDLRRKLHQDEEFQSRYLAFMDDIIHHHLPDAPDDEDVIMAEVGEGDHSRSPSNLKRDPRQEMPPSPLDEHYAEEFREDHRLLGEALQRHQQPKFDPETNSVHLRVKDPDINWHNPELPVATRYNHDLKSVQSGRSSAAAAAYITSYATKSDETPANQISMINTVFQRLEEHSEVSVETKTLLSKCVMQFGRERQLHAQQVATYVRDLGDTMQSHQTVPMLSGSMISKVYRLWGNPRDSTLDSSSMPDVDMAVIPNSGISEMANQQVEPGADVADSEAGDSEEMQYLSSGGLAHQVDDYLRRGTTLKYVVFYVFVRYSHLVLQPKKPNKSHHRLDESHPNFKTHFHRYNVDRPRGIPRMISKSDGTQSHGDPYCAAMLTHFRPFSIHSPIKAQHATYEDIFATTAFSASAIKVMSNWAALMECDDARDEEQLLRRKREATRDAHNDEAMQLTAEDGIDDPEADINTDALRKQERTQSMETTDFVGALSGSGWFEATSHILPTEPVSTTHLCPPFSNSRKRQWTKEQNDVEAAQKAERTVAKASSGVLSRDLGFEEHFKSADTLLSAALDFDDVSRPEIPPDTEVMADIDQALRIGTQKLDEPFGGINVIFAGDLCQLPPVASSPLYTVKSGAAQSAEVRTKIELGRAAWLQLVEVVDFDQQMRMKDPQMAETLSRLRLRECTEAYADLFNGNVLRSRSNKAGATLQAHTGAIALARTNETVRVLNLRKAAVQAQSTSNTLVISHAQDSSTSKLSETQRRALLSYNGSARSRSAIGRVPLFVGMPVVYRGPNISVTLGITNGTFATVAGWDLERDEWGLTVPRGVVLQFSPGAKWTMTGLPSGCLPISPGTSTFNFLNTGSTTPTSTTQGASTTTASQRVSRKQFPVQPGFAMTIHSAQGVTSDSGVIVDLRSGGFEAEDYTLDVIDIIADSDGSDDGEQPLSEHSGPIVQPSDATLDEPTIASAARSSSNDAIQPSNSTSDALTIASASESTSDTVTQPPSSSNTWDGNIDLASFLASGNSSNLLNGASPFPFQQQTPQPIPSTWFITYVP
ncbi:hypothetical protein CF335_g5110 [Tilletia laevis]|nr:hypothetical protein CF335_g5110 [Tilletia laevis]